MTIPGRTAKSPYESEQYQQTTVAGTKEKSPMLSSTGARQPLEMDGCSDCGYGRRSRAISSRHDHDQSFWQFYQCRRGKPLECGPHRRWTARPEHRERLLYDISYSTWHPWSL